MTEREFVLNYIIATGWYDSQRAQLSIQDITEIYKKAVEQTNDSESLVKIDKALKADVLAFCKERMKLYTDRLNDEAGDKYDVYIENRWEDAIKAIKSLPVKK